MSEKLTVAELLARNGREPGSADTGRRRRRHRNLEKGGVSVAELTGSIPVVQTEDDDTADESAVKDADKPAEKAAPKVAAKDDVAAQPEKQETPGKKPQQDQRSVSRTPERPEEKTGQLAAAKDTQDVQDAQNAQSIKGAEAEKPTFGEVARGKVADKPKAEPEAKSEVKPEAKKATKQVKPIKPAEKPGKAEKAEKPGKAGATAAAVAGGAGAAGAAGVAKSTEADAADKVGVKTNAKQAKAEARSDSQVTSDERAQFAQLEESLEDGEVVEYEDDTISWPMMALQAILAIAVGVGVFFGFSLVWAKAPAVLALVLAIAVTLLLVGLVHALLRHRDKLLMILAAVVGLVLTIGPRLIQGL